MKMLVTAFALGLLCAFWGIAQGYDKQQGKFPPAKEVYARSVVVVSCRGSGEGTKLVFSKDKRDYDKFKTVGTFAQRGMGVVLSNGSHQYILTNAHVIVPKKLMAGEDPVKVEKLMNYVLLATDYYGQYAPCPVTISYKNDKYDLALLKVPEEWIAFEPLSIPIGSLSDLQPKDALSGILQGRDGATTFGHGKAESDRSKLVTNPKSFAMNMKLKKGDSGSPIFAYDDGRPVFIGIATAYLESERRDFYLSIGTRVDLLMEIISGR